MCKNEVITITRTQCQFIISFTNFIKKQHIFMLCSVFNSHTKRLKTSNLNPSLVGDRLVSQIGYLNITPDIVLHFESIHEGKHEHEHKLTCLNKRKLNCNPVHSLWSLKELHAHQKFSTLYIQLLAILNVVIHKIDFTVESNISNKFIFKIKFFTNFEPIENGLEFFVSPSCTKYCY